jgi:hypothetical protein
MGESGVTNYYRRWAMGVLYGTFIALLISLVWVPWNGHIYHVDLSGNFHEASFPIEHAPIWAGPQEEIDDFNQGCDESSAPCQAYLGVDWARHFRAMWIPAFALGLITGPLWATIRQS